VNWVKPENIHLTLKFLGEVDEDRIPSIKGVVREGLQGERSLFLSLDGLGVFPNPRAPRVIWVGIEGEGERLKRLQEKLESAMEEEGFPREARSFSPHVTLGRVRSRGGALGLMDLIHGLGRVQLGSYSARSIELMRSQLQPAGAIYSIMEAFPLLGSSPSSSPL